MDIDVNVPPFELQPTVDEPAGTTPDGGPRDASASVDGASVRDASADADTDAARVLGVGDGLDPETELLAEATASETVDSATVVLPNGKMLSAYLVERHLDAGVVTQGAPDEVTGPQQKKNDIVAKMVAAGLELAALPTKFHHPDEGPNRPAQDGTKYPAGLAYIYGSRDYSRRVAPSEAGGACTELLYGLDCSGLVYVEANRAGLALPTSLRATSLASASPLWEKALEPFEHLGMKMVDPDDAPETGDIINWPPKKPGGSGHVGIVFVSGTTTFVIQSNGDDQAACADNMPTRRGPRVVELSKINGWFSPRKPTRQRIVVDMTGDWDFHLRCSGKPDDAAVVRMSIGPKGGVFHANGTGTDYNGTPLTIALDGDYDQSTNILNGVLVPTNDRKDSFQNRKLVEDDTGYFDLTKVVDNGACLAQGRLVRIE